MARIRSRVTRLFHELRRRKVFRSFGAYAIAGLAAIEGADILAPRLGLPDWVVSLVTLFVIVGAPIVLAVSWIYDWSGGQLRRDPADAARDLAVAGPDGGAPAPHRPLAANGIAVLPFTNLGPDGERDYFTDGITEEITAALCRVPELRVIARSSVYELFTKTTRSVGEIGRRLGVAVVVEGSVRRHEGRVRIIVQAVDVETEASLWSDIHDREMEDIFAVQAGVARRVAEGMAARISPEMEQDHRRQRTSDTEAYDLYLRALHLWSQREETAVRRSLEYLERALERDPDFALAHAGVAIIHMTMAIYGMMSPETAERAVVGSAERALRGGREPAEALVARGCARAMFRWEWDAAERDMRAAVEANPNYATAHQWLAVNVLAPRGRFDEAYESLEAARAIDPVSPAVGVSRGVLAYFRRDWSAALACYDEVERLHPDFANIHFFRGRALAASGDLDAAIASLEVATDRADASAEALAALGHAEALAGRGERALERLRALEARDSWVSPVLIAQVHLGLGRVDAALAALESAADRHAPDLVWIGVRPAFDPLVEEERFRILLDRLGVDGGRPPRR